MKSEIDKRWQYDKLEKDILQSQKRRLFVQETLLKGKWTGWDHEPFVDATRSYVRGAIDLLRNCVENLHTYNWKFK